MTETIAAPARPRVRTDSRLRDYLLGAFGFTWALWVPAGLAARHGGRAEVKGLLTRLRLKGVAARWFALAMVMGAVTVVPAAVYLLLGGTTDRSEVTSHLAVIPLHFLLVATVGGGLDEELGWRGMAQPLLQARLAPMPANLLLGAIWACWHLPLWLDPHSPQSAYNVAVYCAVIVGHSLVTGYLYNASGGSLLIAVIVHSANNTFDGLRYAILGDGHDGVVWQLVLAAASLGLGLGVALRTHGRLGLAGRAAHRQTPAP